MTLDSLDLGRALLSACGFLLACTSAPGQIELTTSSGSDTSGGPTTVTTSGPDETTASADGSGSGGSGDETGPVVQVCGNGIVEATEECDLGENNGQGDYCTSECAFNVCGDGYAGPGEACDDGNTNDGDQCTSSCGLPSCGNGVVEGLEECDEGPNNSPTGECLPSCLDAECGDQNLLDGTEVCDTSELDGHTCVSHGFGGGTLLCAMDCLSFDTSMCDPCGNGAIDRGEACDGTNVGAQSCETQGQGPGTLGCAADCMSFDVSMCDPCGNGMIDTGEDCDGVNLNGQSCELQGQGPGTLGCSPDCTFDLSACSPCGNGVVDAGEMCDGGNLDGHTCETQVATGSMGVLLCAPDCMSFDTTECCLPEGEPCMQTSQCCGELTCTDPPRGPPVDECTPP